MRAQQRLKEANERIARALDHAREARRRFLYNEPDLKVLKELNDTVKILEDSRTNIRGSRMV